MPIDGVKGAGEMSKLSHYIKLRNSAIGCDAKLFECDKYLDCDSCLEDKIKEHDKQIRADAIDDFANYLVEQGILGSRCISDGEITDYGKVYAKKYKEQLKEQK